MIARKEFVEWEACVEYPEHGRVAYVSQYDSGKWYAAVFGDHRTEGSHHSEHDTLQEARWTARREATKPRVPRLRCDQCCMFSINGMAVHELGCPNENARWDAEEGEWVQTRECFECGCRVDRGDDCCNSDRFDWNDLHEVDEDFHYDHFRSDD